MLRLLYGPILEAEGGQWWGAYTRHLVRVHIWRIISVNPESCTLCAVCETTGQWAHGMSSMGKITESLEIWERGKRHNKMRRQIKKMKWQNFLKVCLASHTEVCPWKCQEDMVFASQMLIHAPLGKIANLFAVVALGWLVFRWEDRVLFTYFKIWNKTWCATVLRGWLAYE